MDNPISPCHPDWSTNTTVHCPNTCFASFLVHIHSILWPKGQWCGTKESESWSSRTGRSRLVGCRVVLESSNLTRDWFNLASLQPWTSYAHAWPCKGNILYMQCFGRKQNRPWNMQHSFSFNANCWRVELPKCGLTKLTYSSLIFLSYPGWVQGQWLL